MPSRMPLTRRERYVSCRAMQEYVVYCGRADRLTLEDVVRLSPPQMSVRKAEVLDGFVVEAPDLCIGVFACKEERLQRERAAFTADPSEVPPRPKTWADAFAMPRKYLVSSALLERLMSAPKALEVSFMRGSSDDSRATGFVTRLLAQVDGYLAAGLGRITDARGHALSAGPPELQVIPPDQDRVVRRALCLAAMAMRSHLEEGSLEEVGELLARLRRWLPAAGAGAELEPHERMVLDAPLGSLSLELRAKASWQAEGLGTLAWALGVADLPAFDVPIDPAEVADRLQFLMDPIRPVAARLRDAEERSAMSDRVFSVHWRLQEFVLSREIIDFRSAAEEAWFGPLDLSKIPLVNAGTLFRRRLDLAVRGKPLTALAEQELLSCVRIAEERHRAMNWLTVGGVYSEVDTST